MVKVNDFLIMDSFVFTIQFYPSPGFANFETKVGRVRNLVFRRK
jgi:hypothetical protein